MGTRLPGTLGSLDVTTLGYADGPDYTILYAATAGGITNVTNPALAGQELSSQAGSQLMGAGVYRYVRYKNVPGLAGVPALLSPASGILLTNTTPQLGWHVSANAQHYELQLATSSNFATIVLDKPILLSSEFTPAGLLPNSKYYWRVRAFNSQGKASAWSAVRNFRTDLPTPVNLEADTTVQNLRPNFTWQMPAYPFPLATSFTLQVSQNSTFSKLVLSKKTTGLGYTPATDLPRSLPLYWRVPRQRFERSE